MKLKVRAPQNDTSNIYVNTSSNYSVKSQFRKNCRIACRFTVKSFQGLQEQAEKFRIYNNDYIIILENHVA